MFFYENSILQSRSPESVCQSILDSLFLNLGIGEKDAKKGYVKTLEELIFSRIKGSISSIADTVNDNQFLYVELRNPYFFDLIDTLNGYRPTDDQMNESWMDIRDVLIEDESFRDITIHVYRHSKYMIVRRCVMDFLQEIDILLESKRFLMEIEGYNSSFDLYFSDEMNILFNLAREFAVKTYAFQCGKATKSPAADLKRKALNNAINVQVGQKRKHADATSHALSVLDRIIRKTSPKNEEASLSKSA